MSRLSRAIEKSQHSYKTRFTKQLKESLREETPIGLRKKGKHHARITVTQKLEIADRVVRGCEPIKDLAMEFRVSPSRISNIVREMRTKPELVREQINQEATKALTDENLAAFVDEKLNRGELIQRAEDVMTQFEESSGTKVKLHRVRQVLRNLLNLRYNKIVKLPIHGNSERCLVQRQ